MNKFTGGLSCLGMVLGIFLGPIVLTVSVYFYYWAFRPDILADAQWGMMILQTVPLGAVLGAVGGAVIFALMSRVMDDEEPGKDADSSAASPASPPDSD